MHETLFISMTWKLAQQNCFVENYPLETEATEALIITDTGWQSSTTSFNINSPFIKSVTYLIHVIKLWPTLMGS